MLDRREIKDLLNNNGLKSTHQRIVILDAVYQMHNHPTVEQVYDVVQANHPSISLATVYKALEIFTTHGLLAKVSSQEGQLRYDPKLDNHGHIYVGNTKEIIDYYDSELNNIILDFFKKKRVNNLKIKNITLQINGDKIDLEKEVQIK